MLEYEDDEFVAVPKDSYKIAAGLNPDYDGSIPVRSTRSQNNGETSLFVGNLPFEFTDEQLQSLFFKYGTIKNSFIVTRKMKSEEDRMVSKGCGYVVFSNSDDAAKAMTELNEHEIGGRKIYVSIAKDSHKKHSVKKESKQPTAPSYTVYGLMVLVENLPDDITAKYLFKRWKRIDGFHKLIHPCPEPKAARVIFKTYDSAKNGVLKLNDHIIKGSKVTAKLFGSKANRLIVRNLPFDCSEEDIKTHFSSIGSVKEITFPKQVTGSSRGFAFIWYSSIFDSLKAVEKLNFSELKGRKIAVDWAASKTDYTKKENESDTKSKPSSIDKDEVSNSGQDVDDHESSDVEDPAAESDVMDVESNSDDEPEEDAEKEIDEAIRKEKIRNGSKDIQEGRTVFIRHIPLDANENDLRKAFSRFGKILKVSLVYKKIDDESKIGTGSGFVQFESKYYLFFIFAFLSFSYSLPYRESVDSAIAAARVSLDGRTRAKSSKIRTSSFAQALACEGVGGIWIGGKFLDVSRAISRDNAVKVVHDRENADKEDKRNLYLAKEGRKFNFHV